MKRRKFLQLSALAAGAFSVPFIAGCNSKPLNAAVSQPLFLSHIFDSKMMKATGDAYRKQVPAEDSKSKLGNLLTEGSNITETTDAATVHKYYDGKSTADFKALNTVIVNGWVLAVTEARQCALYSFTQN